MAKKKQQGGKRAGAGRKPRHGVPVVSSSINLPPAGWRAMDALRGRMSRSEWVLAQVLREDSAGGA